MEDQINALKEKGNAALAAGKHDEAVAAYTEALKLNDENYVFSLHNAHSSQAICTITIPTSELA
uniref:Uncharacterized protein n=1 Tax=Lutzomyia longipalpis TaxID=7200 RepID=A0A1B0CMH2_LUTLO